ncbi:MAG: amidohydrolase family protein [Candidatus Omnitrophica bacterium]|nr:amidohydrolase family protein [Candidatus Omnitrophota bacterium]MCM8803249.1 amidohydrolase family protein [Candidatus Omnitrophota bacterium]
MKIKEKLMEFVDNIEIIDAHEHLPPERVRVEKEVDIFILFSHYTKGDLLRAGMSEEQYKTLFNYEIPIEKRWKIFSSYWEKIRYTSYSRAVLISLKKFYGFDDINEKNYIEISEKIKEFNKKGIYKKVLRDTCKIKFALTQCGTTKTESEILVPLMPLNKSGEMNTFENLTKSPYDENIKIKTIDDLIEEYKKYILKSKEEGAVGFKTRSLPFGLPDRKKAKDLFNRIIKRKAEKAKGNIIPPSIIGTNPIFDFVSDELIKFAGKQGLVIAVHTGYWGDFRRLSPENFIPVLQRHPEVKFDIYHCGFPYVREALNLGKEFSNVYLNFAWTHIISQKFAIDAIDECLDLIPINKIIGFGGDYQLPVEKVYGHLFMAKEDIITVLEKKIKERKIKFEESKKVIKDLFFNNPYQLYNLSNRK